MHAAGLKNIIYVSTFLKQNRYSNTVRPRQSFDTAFGFVRDAHEGFVSTNFVLNCSMFGNFLFYTLSFFYAQCDTDSVAYVYRPSENTTVNQLYGDKLGQLSKVVPDDTEIIEFAAPGKKMYSMELRKRNGQMDAIVKAKGVRITHESKSQLNHFMFKRLVQKLDEKLEVSFATHFKRDPSLSSITISPLKKVVRVTLNSRYYYGYLSVPWGWKADLP